MGRCLGRGRRRCSQTGAVAVEFALILPVLVMLIFGVTTAGLAYADHVAITNAAREGARLGAAVEYTNTSTSPTTYANTVRQRVQQVYFNSESALTDDQVCVKLVDSSGAELAAASPQGTSCGTEPSSPGGLTSGTCVLKVWVAKPRTISIMVAPVKSLTIAAQSVSYYGREVASCTTD